MRECQKGTREDKRAALINLREELEDGAGIYTAASARRCLTTCAALSRLATEYVLLTITSIIDSKRPLLCRANTGHTIANIVDAVELSWISDLQGKLRITAATLLKANDQQCSQAAVMALGSLMVAAVRHAEDPTIVDIELYLNPMVEGSTAQVTKHDGISVHNISADAGRIIITSLEAVAHHGGNLTPALGVLGPTFNSTLYEDIRQAARTALLHALTSPVSRETATAYVRNALSGMSKMEEQIRTSQGEQGVIELHEKQARLSALLGEAERINRTAQIAELRANLASTMFQR
jgi:hypothetical protein